MSKRSTLQAALVELQQVQSLLQQARPSQCKMAPQLEPLLDAAVSKVQEVLGFRRWPEPTVDPPDMTTLQEWMWDDGGCEATDGCWIEPDGVCQHGHPSWMLRLGLI